jgi:hypothetical protein
MKVIVLEALEEEQAGHQVVSCKMLHAILGIDLFQVKLLHTEQQM